MKPETRPCYERSPKQPVYKIISQEAIHNPSGNEQGSNLPARTYTLAILMAE